MDPLLIISLCVLVGTLSGIFAWAVGVQYGFRSSQEEYREALEIATREILTLRSNVERLQREARDARVEGIIIGQATTHSDQRREARSAGVPVTGVCSEAAPDPTPGRSRVVMIDGEVPEIPVGSTRLPDVEVVQVTVNLADAVSVENLTQATAALRRGRAIVASLNDGMVLLRVCRIPVGFYTEIRAAGGQPVRLLLDTAKDVNTWLRNHFRR